MHLICTSDGAAQTRAMCPTAARADERRLGGAERQAGRLLKKQPARGGGPYPRRIVPSTGAACRRGSAHAEQLGDLVVGRLVDELLRWAELDDALVQHDRHAVP